VPKESRHGSGPEADRKRPHEELREEGRSEEDQRLQAHVYQSLLNSLDIGVANTTRDGEILYANRRFAEILGLKEFHNPVGSYLKQFVSARDWGSLSEALRHGSAGVAEGEITFVEAESSEVRTVRCSFAPLSDDHTGGIKVIATEVTELVEATKALRESEASLQNLSARLLQVQDNERRRMARDLHDVTGQELAVAIMGIDRMARNAAHDKDLQASLSETAGQLRQVESEIRTLSYVLHPPLLDEMGLRSAIQWYVEGFSKRTGIEIAAKISENLPRFGIEQETALFRVIQEALTNVFRHSGSRRARVLISLKAGVLEARVEDDGKGLQRDQLTASAKPGVGIQSMRDRLKTLGGTLDLRSGPQGTQIIASLPLPSKGDSEIQPPEAEPVSEGLPANVAVMEPARKRVLIADDHEIARRGIRALLGDQPDLEICGEAADGMEAVTKTQQLKPDLLILDLSMPRLGGFSAVNEIRRAGLSTKILMYTTHSYPGLERVARAAGCDGFVLKSNASQDLIRGARTVLQGGKFYGSEMAQANSA